MGRLAGGACDLSDDDERTTDDGRLIDAFRRRDPKAAELLYQVAGRRAFGLAFRVLGDAPAAEDAVQEAFLTIWRQADRLDPERGRLEPLLLTIVHRRAVDMLRVRKRTATASLPGRLEIEDLDALDPADAVVSAQDGAAVRRGLAALPLEQRVAIEKAYFDGMTHAEIAAELHLPPGTVKSRLRLGLQKMRSLLSGEMV